MIMALLHNSDSCIHDNKNNTTVVPTLVLPFSALKQGKLGRIVNHSELVEQSFNNLTGMCAGADVEVLGRILGQIEGCSTLCRGTLLPRTILRGDTSTRWRQRHRP